MYAWFWPSIHLSPCSHAGAMRENKEITVWHWARCRLVPRQLSFIPACWLQVTPFWTTKNLSCNMIDCYQFQQFSSVIEEEECKNVSLIQGHIPLLPVILLFQAIFTKAEISCCFEGSLCSAHPWICHDSEILGSTCAGMTVRASGMLPTHPPSLHLSARWVTLLKVRVIGSCWRI